MRGLCLIGLFLASAAMSRGAESSDAPVLQWITALGGSGTNTATAVAADSQGNLYIAGNTTSLDLPTVGAAQPHPGGSTVVRIDPATGASQNIYFQGVTGEGTVDTVTADPENPQSIFAAGSAGVFHSRDGGNTWISLSPIPSNPTVLSVAVDPTNGNTLYASTPPLGAFKSTNGGASWTPINKGVPPAPDGTLDIYQIWVDPKSAAVALASSATGLLRSVNGGASWTQVLGPVSSLTFDPFTAGTVYACGPNPVGIVESTDHGQTWTALSLLPGYDNLAMAIVADPFHRGVLYASGYGGGLFESTDAGVTWTQESNSYAASNAVVMAADPNQPVLYASGWPSGILVSTDGFNTFTTLAPQLPQVTKIVVAGASIFAVPMQTTDVFVAKLNPNGNMVYATYFGGSGSDTASAIAVGRDGSVYVSGSTNSLDFPVTPGSYTGGGQSSYVFKLKPDGSLAWSSFFASASTTVRALAVDDEGDPYLAGFTTGGLPVTDGAYQTSYQPPPSTTCGPGSIFCPPPGPTTTSAFLTKFNASGSGFVFSTYVANDSQNNAIVTANALALAPNGDIYLAGNNAVFLMNGSGSALLASQPTLAINAIALDSGQNVYATGFGYPPVTAGAFETSPERVIPSLPGVYLGESQQPAFVMKLDSGLSQILSATLLSGEAADSGNSISIDSSGNVITGGNTTSMSFPTLAPFQSSFSGTAGSGYVAGLDPSLSHLLFSTFVGGGPFTLVGALPDGNGNILLAGSGTTTVFANKIALPPAPATRLDSVSNAASRIAGPLSPGETVVALGAGFGPNAQLTINGEPATILSQAATSIQAVVPSDIDTTGALQVMATSGGTVSNAMWMPAAAASPGIYSVDGSGTGQGYILNSDGTVNSPANPVAMGSPITILATGVGQMQFTGQYAVTNLPVSVFVDGFYTDGISAVVKQVPGLPGPVYEISVYVPNPATDASQNPNLTGFTMPPQVEVRMVLGDVNSSNPDWSALVSQAGIALSVKQ